MKIILLIVVGMLSYISYGDTIMMRAINVIARVESEGQVNRATCVGDHGAAVGWFQLHKNYVDDADRFVSPRNWRLVGKRYVCINPQKRIYTYRDRIDPLKSAKMVRIYLRVYGNAYTRKTGKPVSFEVLVRIHNGGPNGWTKAATKAYYYKCLRKLK